MSAQILKDELKADKQKFALAMSRAIVRYDQFMDKQYESVRIYFESMEGQRRRIINRSKARALIELDREQIQATEAYKFDKHIAHERFKSLSKPKPFQSAWFGGEYDERTYF